MNMRLKLHKKNNPTPTLYNFFTGYSKNTMCNLNGCIDNALDEYLPSNLKGRVHGCIDNNIAKSYIGKTFDILHECDYHGKKVTIASFDDGKYIFAILDRFFEKRPKGKR